MHGLGQQHGQHGDAVAVPAGVGRLLVDGLVEQADEGLKEVLELDDELPVGERNGRLRGERLGEALVGLAERDNDARSAVLGVDELEDADDLVLVVLHRHREEGLRMIAHMAVEGLGTGEVEALLLVGVGDGDRAIPQHGVGDDHRGVFASAGIAKLDGRIGDLHAGGAAHGDAQRIGADDLEGQRVLAGGAAVKRAAIRVGDFFGRDEDLLEQPVEVFLLRKRDADLVELRQTGNEVVR